jgi:glycine oxidase
MSNESKILKSQADFVIIGNGALALFLALELAERNENGSSRKIVLIGPRDRVAGASQAAGAMLGCFGEVTTDTLRTESGRKRFEIGVAAHKLWDRKLTQIAAECDAKTSLKVSDDTYIVLNSVGHVLDTLNFNSIINAVREYQQPWSEVDPETIPGYHPRPDCRAFRCIRLHDEGAVNARSVLASLERVLEARGVTLIDDVVHLIRSEHGRAIGVTCGSGHLIDAANIVVAAGAQSERLVRTASRDFKIMPTFPGLGLGMLAKRSKGEAFKSVVRTSNRGFGCGLHVVPQGDGREYLGSTNRVVHEVMNVSWLEDLRYLSKYSMQQLDENIAHHQVENWLRGNRPITYDGFPLIGWLPMSGLYLMTGTFRDGFHASPLLAIHVANELEGKPGVIDPIVKPDRSPVITRTVEESIDEYSMHSIATWYEVGSDSCEMPTQVLEAFYKEKARKIYDRIGIDYGIGPDVLWYAHGDVSGMDHIRQYAHA